MKKILLLMIIFTVSGCGVGQIISDGASNVGSAIFYAKVKELKIDFTARESLNPDDQDHPLSVMIRTYQLKDSKAFESAEYTALYNADREALASDLLALKEVILPPGGAMSINETMNDDTKFIGVAAFFRKEEGELWRLIIPRDTLSASKPFKIEAMDFAITPIEEK